MTYGKIETLNYLAGIGEGRPVVLCCGCFDVLHPAHVRHLQAAKKLAKDLINVSCDLFAEIAREERSLLIVLLTPDRFVGKGAGRPFFPERERVEVLAALSCVDYVIINEHPTAVEAIKLLRPAIYVKGAEYRDRITPALQLEKEAVESVGGKLVFTDDSVEYHSTQLIEVLRA